MIVKQPDEKFPTAPEGTFLAVCVDEIDLGMMKSSYGGEERERHMVRLVWQIDEEMSAAECSRFRVPEGSRYTVKQDYTASLDEKAKLRKHLQSWRGRAFTFNELVGFDLENIIGQCCLLSIVQNTGRKGGVFSNVESVMKLPRGTEPIVAVGYTRVKDRTKSKSEPVPPKVEEQPPSWDGPVTDDDVPF